MVLASHKATQEIQRINGLEPEKLAAGPRMLRRQMMKHALGLTPDVTIVSDGAAQIANSQSSI